MWKWLDTGGNELVTIIYIISGLGVAFFSLLKVKSSKINRSRIWFFFSVAGLLACIIYAVLFGIESIESISIDYKTADMLPIIHIMNERYIEGENIYAIIPEIHGGMFPIYLPAMWLPFIFSVILDFDPRWTTIFFILSSTVLIYFSDKAIKRNFLSLMWILLVYLLFRLIFVEDSRIITMTEEGIVIGYYIFLCYALWKRNTILISFAICLCLLSRYALVFWVPVYLVFLYIQNEKARAYKTAIYTSAIGLFLLVITKSLSKIPYFIGLQSSYKDTISALDLEWKYKPIIQEGLGIAKFFEYDQLHILHDLLLICSLLAPVLFLFLFVKFKEKFNPVFFPLACLKISLVVFFNLLTMPYIYLFFTSSFISIAIFYFFITQKSEGAVIIDSA